VSGGDPPVRFLDAEPNGLAAMLGGLIAANLAAHPERARDLNRGATYSVLTTDAGVSASIRLSRGTATIRNGVVRRAQVRIEADSGTLVGLSAVPLRFGLPDVRAGDGREVLRKLIGRRLRVRGLLLHPGKLARLNRLLSVK
jgi:hypothetical protein